MQSILHNMGCLRLKDKIHAIGIFNSLVDVYLMCFLLFSSYGLICAEYEYERSPPGVPPHHQQQQANGPQGGKKCSIMSKISYSILLRSTKY